MPPTASLFSKESAKRFGKSVKKTFFRKKEDRTDAPAPIKTEPGSRQIKPDDAKAEVTETERKKADDNAKKDGEGEEEAKKVKQITSGTSDSKPIDSTRTPATTRREQETIEEEELTVQGTYAAIWDHESHDAFRRVEYGQRSYYTPNALSIFESLHASHRVLADNEHMRWANRNYLSMPVTIYYSVLYYIRILYVREMLGENTETESRFYRAFSRKFKPQSLPIAGFLQPQFGSIAAYKPKDQRLTWMLPSFEAMFTQAPAQPNGYNYVLNAENQLIQPNIPVLYEWFKNYTSLDALDDQHTHNEQFVPRKSQNANFRLGGYEIQAGAANVLTHEAVRILGSLGIDQPGVEYNDKLTEALAWWNESRFANNGPADMAAGPAHTRLDAFLRMEGNNWNWFEDCITMASIHAKYFKNPVTMNDLDYTGSSEIGIRCTVRVNTVADHPEFTLAANTILWFPRIKRNAEGTLRWYEKQVKDYHLWNARHTLTDAAVTIHYQTVEGANPAVDRSVTGLEDSAVQMTPAPRWGPAYSRLKNSNMMNHYTLTLEGNCPAPIEVLDRRINLLTSFYLAKGQDN